MPEIKPRAMLSADGREFTLKVGQWRGTFPVEKLDDWIATYEWLRDRRSDLFGGQPFKPHYASTVDVLRKLKERIPT